MSYVQWSPYVTYQTGDGVYYETIIYLALSLNTNIVPLGNPGVWSPQGTVGGGVTNPLTSNIQSNSFGLTSTNGMSLTVGAPGQPSSTIMALPPATDFTIRHSTAPFETPFVATYSSINMTGAGTVTAPTVLPSDDSNKVATTSYVKSVVAGSGGGNMIFSGVSAVGNHCVGTNIPGTNYGPSALNEDSSTFNFGSKGLTANSLTSTTSLYLTASNDVNLNALNLNVSCPVNVGAPGVANTKVSDSQVKVRNGTVPEFTNMDINGIEVSNGFDSSRLTFEKLYNNANNATTGSIITIATDYANNVLNGVTTFTSPGLTLDCPQVDLVQDLIVQSSDNITTNCVNYTLNASSNITSNSTDVAMNTTGVFGISAQGNVTISSAGTATNITLASTGNTTNNTTNFNVNTTNDVSLTATTDITLSATGNITNTATNVNTTTSGAINLTATGNVNVNASQAEFSATPIHTTSSTTSNSFIKIGGTSAEVLLADGTTAPYNSGGSGGNFYQYRFSTSTTPTVVGHIQYNNANPILTTTVWVNHITDDAIDIDFYLAQIGIGDILYIQDKNLSTNFAKYIVTSSTQPVFNSYWAFGVTYANSEGTGTTGFANNHQIIFTSYVDSATINTRLNALETKTVYQSTPTLNQTNFAGTVLADTLKITGGLSSNYLMADGSTSALTTITTSGVGTSLVKTGTSPGFELNSLLASTGLSSSLSGNTITLTNSSPASGISLASTGTGTSLLNSTANPTFTTKSLAVGTGLSIASTTNTITLTNTVTGSTLANAGAGTSLVVSGTAPSLSVKSLSNGTGITLTDASNNIQITNSSPASGISLSNAGTGTSLLSSTTNPTFTTKSLTAGTNVTFTSTANDITINASGGGGGTYTFTNGGAGTTLVSTASTATDFKPVSITAGTNVTLSASGTDIVINSAGALGTNTLNAVSIPTSASIYYPTFIASGVNTTISAVNTDSGGLTYVPTTNALTAGAMNSITFTSSTAIPGIGFVGASSSASQIQTTGIPTNASPFYLTFVPTSASANAETLGKDVGLSYIPTSNQLTTSLYVGDTFTGTGALSAISFVGTATNSTQIQTTGNPSSASTYYITFVPSSASANNEILSKDVGLTYQPSTDSIGCGIVNAITFNSSTPVASAGFVGTCSQALQLATTLQSVTASLYYPIFAPLASSSTGQAMSVDVGLSFQPSTNTLTTTNFAGALNGTATRATAIVGGTASTNQLVVQTGVNTTGLLATGTAGQFLQSNGASLPTWVANSTIGFQMSYGGKILLTNDYLTPNRWADTTATSVTTSSYLSQWTCPVACNITAWSSTVQSSTSATLSIVIAGVTGTAITGVATSTTNSGTITARPVSAGAIVEVRIVGTITNATCVTLYFT